MCWLDWKKTNSRSSGVDTDCVMAETQNTMHFEWAQTVRALEMDAHAMDVDRCLTSMYHSCS